MSRQRPVEYIVKRILEPLLLHSAIRPEVLVEREVSNMATMMSLRIIEVSPMLDREDETLP